ncbi:hypothetical protein BH11ACT5_BH11ACT5_13700 [soil metagenome]
MKRPQLVASAVIALALAVGPAASATAVPAVAQGGDDFEFQSFHADYTLDQDSSGRATLSVVETIVALFPPQQNRGIVRALPLKDGEVPLGITMKSITDEHGTPWHYERNDYDGFAEFALGTDEFLEGPTTFVLSYTLRDPVRYFSDSGDDEFYWDINGTGWAQTFDEVSAHIEVGPALAAALTGSAACYVGYYGESNQCELSREGGGFDVTVGPVGPYNTLTVSIGFAGGTVTQPQLPRDSWIVQVAPKVLFGLLVLLLILSIIIKTAVWRDARGRGTVIAEYTPPKNSDLLLDANVVKRPGEGLPALFVDFAVRGLVKVVDNEPGEPGVSGRRRFSLELVTSDGATARELGVLVTVFGSSLKPGKRVRPGELDADKGAALYTLTAKAEAEALTEGLRAKPKSHLPQIITRTAWLAVLAQLGIGIWAIVNDVLDGTVVWPGVGTFVLAVAVPSVLILPARLTRAGAEQRDYLRGIRLYLTVAEEERLRMLQSPDGALRINVNDRDAVVKLYERLLPYAVLWGVEDQWVEKLRAVYPSGSPDWLDGDTFDSSVFRSFTSSSTASVRPIVTTSSSGGGSSWSSSGGSSSSSGSSGGGFSGGGGGGGGGGGR